MEPSSVGPGRWDRQAKPAPEHQASSEAGFDRSDDGMLRLADELLRPEKVPRTKCTVRIRTKKAKRTRSATPLQRFLHQWKAYAVTSLPPNTHSGAITSYCNRREGRPKLSESWVGLRMTFAFHQLRIADEGRIQIARRMPKGRQRNTTGWPGSPV